MNYKLNKKALNLSYFNIIYNIIEGLLSIFAGLIAGSVSLVGFGLDSAVESSSAVIMVWRFKKTGKIEEYEEENIEKRALEIRDFEACENFQFSRLQIFDLQASKIRDF